MRKRFTALLLLCGALTPFAVSGEKPPAAGKKIADFTLTDPRDGGKHSLADFKDKKAVVVVFTGTECPISNAYLPRLAELHKEFADKGVAFLAVNANVQDSPADVAKHAKEHKLPFPVLKDAGNVVADAFEAKRTPEAFVLDGGRRVRYRGRIDDQYGVNVTRPRPARRGLAEALGEVIAGKPVTAAVTEAPGCLIARHAQPKGAGKVTYAKEVSRILQARCQECHRPGQIGPMALLDYDAARAWGDTIREVVQDGRMPPWYADPKHGKFQNDRSLPEQDKAALLAWIDGGCPKGDDKDLPKPKKFADGWRIGKPDVVVTMPKAYEVPAEAPKGGIEYQRFEVDPGFTEDKWVRRAEAKPGVASVVHHILIYVVYPGETYDPRKPGRVLCGVAPGDTALYLPDGVAKRIPKGSKLIFEMHYTPDGTARKDRSSVALIFNKGVPEREAITRGVGNARFRVPPGAADYKVESEFVFPEDGHLLGFMPHMHLRGKDFLYEAVHPDGTREVLLSVPRYNFGWQNGYRLAEPYPMPKGSKLHCVAHFDNSEANPNNPDPKKAVTWGDQTWEEMMIGWAELVYDRKPE